MGEDMLVLEVERGVMKSSYCIAMQYFANNCPLAVGHVMAVYFLGSVYRPKSWPKLVLNAYLNAQLLNALALRIDD